VGLPRRGRRLLSIALAVTTALVPAPAGPVEAATAARGAVVPIDMARFGGSHPRDADSARLRAILRNTNHFALTTWYNEVRNYDAQTGPYLDFGGAGENDIRPAAAQAFGLAVSLRLGVYRTDHRSCRTPPTSLARATTNRLIGSLAHRHVANNPGGGWGTPDPPDNRTDRPDGTDPGWQTALADLTFVAGQRPYRADPKVTGSTAAPGGTIYRAGSGDIYYPHGNDWGPRRRMQFASMDVLADAFGFDSAASRKGAYWEPYHARQVLDMQNRFPDRRTYAGAHDDPDSEDTYPGREEWVAHHAGWAYLARWIKHQGAFSVTNRPY
jgi:hypothetical protein